MRIAVHVAKGASYLIARSLITAMISLASFAVIARVISRSEMGELAVLGLVSAATYVVGGLGVGSTAIKYVASLQARGDHEGARKAGYECLLINGIATLLIATVTFLAANTLGLLLLGTNGRGVLFRFLVWEILALGVNYSLSNLALGNKRFKEFSLIGIGSFAVRQALVLLFLILGLGLPGILIGWGIGDSLNSALLVALIRKIMGPFKIGFGIRRVLSFSAPLYFGETAGFAWTWFDVALLVPLVSLSALGAYNVAVSAYVILASLPGSVSATLFPYYSQLYSDGEVSGTVDLEKAVRVASRYVSLFTIPVAVGLAATALPTVTLLAGNSYSDSAYPLAILSIFLAVACSSNALGATFVVLDRAVTSGLVTLASVVVSILLGVIIVPYIGIMGASVARGASVIIALALSILILRRIMKLRFDHSAYRQAWIASAVMAFGVLMLEWVFYSKFLLPLYVVAGVVVFIACLRFLHGVSLEDLELLSSFLSTRSSFVVNLLGWALGIRRSNVD